VTVPNPDEPAPATTSITEGARNAIRYFAPAGGETQPRQLAVTQDKCNACHLELQFHGNQRESVEYCVVCHTADLTDWGRRPKVTSGTPPAVVQPATVDVAATPDDKEERSVHFRPMIHRIHMGNGLELQKPYVIYGFSGPVFLDESGLPEPSRSRCTACHEGDSYKLEAMPAREPTFANETATPLHVPGSGNPKVPGVAELQPMTAACISCHDYDEPAPAGSTPPDWRLDNAPASLRDHVAAYTSGRTERCLECHADRGVAAVSAVHDVTP
jgi:OmcA/MtrC family decaheme c-type cytochrome